MVRHRGNARRDLLWTACPGKMSGQCPLLLEPNLSSHDIRQVSAGWNFLVDYTFLSYTSDSHVYSNRCMFNLALRLCYSQDAHLIADFWYRAHHLMWEVSCIAKSAWFGRRQRCNSMRIGLAWVVEGGGDRIRIKRALQCTYLSVFLFSEFKYHNTIIRKHWNPPWGL